MTYLLSILIVFGMLAGWVVVQHLGRAFAARHPEFGPAREEGSGCCMGRGGTKQGPQCAVCPKQRLKTGGNQENQPMERYSDEP